MESMSTSRIAVIALVKDGMTLLTQRSLSAKWAPGVWHTPGGRVEDAEPVHEAAIREIKEELGVDVRLEDLSFQGVVAYNQTDAEDVDTFYFVAEKWQNDPLVMEPDKCQDMKWFEFDNMPENITQHTKVMMRRVGRPAYVYVVDGEVKYES